MNETIVKVELLFREGYYPTNEKKTSYWSTWGVSDGVLNGLTMTYPTRQNVNY